MQHTVDRCLPTKHTPKGYRVQVWGKRVCYKDWTDIRLGGRRMTERLTVRHGNRTDCNTLCMEDCDHCWHLGIIREKLARLEDLEEQGRMVILPDGMNLRKLLDILTEYSPGCPSDYNLTNRCELSCFECWLAALKGADE